MAEGRTGRWKVIGRIDHMTVAVGCVSMPGKATATCLLDANHPGAKA
jgi:hypothetical protein